MNFLPRAIFFDLFNTLIDVGSVPSSQGRNTADILGIDRKIWNQACFGNHHEICGPTKHVDVIHSIAHSLDPTIPFGMIEQATNERQRRFDYALKNVEEGILDTLKRLKQKGKIIGLISNASTDEVCAWNESPLSELMDAAIFSCHVGMQKPDPEIYHYALKQVGVSTKDALFIGDGGSKEHLGAQQAGISGLLTTYFIKGKTDKGLSNRGEGSIGTIGHISELLN